MQKLVAVKFTIAGGNAEALSTLLWERVGEPTVWQDAASTAMVARDEAEDLTVTVQLMEKAPTLVRVCMVTEGEPKELWPALTAWGEALAKACVAGVEAYWYTVIEVQEKGLVRVHDAQITSPVVDVMLEKPGKVVASGGAKVRYN